MRLVIVESPYAGDVERNMRYLRACLRDCLMRGEAPFASHGLYTQPGVLDDAAHDERARGISAGFAWREWAHATVVYTDLGISRGMSAGIEHAKHVSDSWMPFNAHRIEYRELGGEWAQGDEGASS